MEIKPSEFRQSISIIKVTQTVDEHFAPIEKKDILILNARAKVLNISGKETILSDKITSNNVKRFYIRYRNVDIDTDCKLVYREKIYNITYVSNVEEKNKYFEIVGEL